MDGLRHAMRHIQSWFTTNIFSSSPFYSFAQPLPPLTSNFYSAFNIWFPRSQYLLQPSLPGYSQQKTLAIYSLSMCKVYSKVSTWCVLFYPTGTKRSRALTKDMHRIQSLYRELQRVCTREYQRHLRGGALFQSAAFQCSHLYLIMCLLCWFANEKSLHPAHLVLERHLHQSFDSRTATRLHHHLRS